MPVGGREGSDRAGDLCARRRHGIAPNQLFTWRRLYADGALSGVGAGEEVVPASEFGALQHQVCELQRRLGKNTLEKEILGEVLDLVQPKKAVGLALTRSGRHAVKTVADAIGVACSNLGSRPTVRRPASDADAGPSPKSELLVEFKEIVGCLPTYGYRRVHVVIRR